MRRVVVTGAVTPIGIGVENFWNSVKEKRTGFDKITKFDTTGFKASLAAEIKDFDPKEFMDFKAARRMELFCQYAVAAAAEAMKILTVWAVMSVPVSEVCRQWNGSIKDCWSVEPPGSIHFLFR